jgi:hypothetical protein
MFKANAAGLTETKPQISLKPCPRRLKLSRGQDLSQTTRQEDTRCIVGDGPHEWIVPNPTCNPVKPQIGNALISQLAISQIA